MSSAYNLYLDQYYFLDPYSCFLDYSRKYIKSILGLKDTFPLLYQFIINQKSIIDLGNGIGYSTIMLKQEFPKMDIYGYNIKESDQFKFCKYLSKKYSFKMEANFKRIREGDILFASEYFEHHEKPIEHLDDLIKNLTPKILILANSFNTRSIGHFIKYLYRDKIIPQEKISRMFNDFLRKDFVCIPTKIWNNKPSIWVSRNEIEFIKSIKIVNNKNRNSLFKLRK